MDKTRLRKLAQEILEILGEEETIIDSLYNSPYQFLIPYIYGKNLQDDEAYLRILTRGMWNKRTKERVIFLTSNSNVLSCPTVNESCVGIDNLVTFPDIMVEWLIEYFCEVLEMREIENIANNVGICEEESLAKPAERRKLAKAIYQHYYV